MSTKTCTFPPRLQRPLYPPKCPKNVEISIKAMEATEATKNVHKKWDIYTKATEAPENVNKNVAISAKATKAT